MIEIAIIGATACGKSETALKLAQNFDSFILSLDSLSLYKEVDIASAKPSKEELKSVKHFGVDILYPNEEFNAAMFMDEYERAKQEALAASKNLIIVGGSSFYLKSMIDGLTDMPKISAESRNKANEIVANDLQKGLSTLTDIDPLFASKIAAQDAYRISRGLEMYFEFKEPPSKLFEKLPKRKVAQNLRIYEISVDREILRERIKVRAKKMFDDKIVDEALYLSQKYGEETKPIRSIGLKETMMYIKGLKSLEEAQELVYIHTSQLAKRQTTFNKTQLSPSFRGSKEDVYLAAKEVFTL